MSQGIICELHIYPVKSLQGVSLEQAELTEKGLKWDRFWMIINEDGQFATQRHLAQMAEVTTTLTEEALILSHPSTEPLVIPLQYQGSAQREGKVWKSECQVLDEGEQARAWLTNVLGQWRGQSLSLVRMAQDFARAVSEKHTNGASNSVNFADGYPYLVCNTASLQALNDKLAEQDEQAVPMSRFRGNIVVETDRAFIEHTNTSLVLNDCEAQPILHLCKPCERCKVTSIDQSTGQVDSPREPLKTLLGMTHINKKGAFFGQNGVIAEQAKGQLPIFVRLGDKVCFEELD